MSAFESVSAGTSRSLVVKIALSPSAETACRSGMKAPLPLMEPVETSVVTPAARL